LAASAVVRKGEGTGSAARRTPWFSPDDSRALPLTPSGEEAHLSAKAYSWVRVLLLDDDDALPLSPDDAEIGLASQLGSDGLEAIDAALTKHAQPGWLKVARVVYEALAAGGFSTSDESHVRLHVRRLISLVAAGVLEPRGNLRRPRWSEVRLPERV
jgi:hypothetical protein